MFRHLSFFPILLLICVVIGSSLTGCQSTTSAPPPLEIKLASDAELLQNAELPDVRSVQVVDRRPQHHVLRMHRGTDPAEFATSTQALATLMSAALTDTFIENPESGAVFTLIIERTLCIAEQTGTRHEVNCHVIIEAHAETDKGRLEKSFEYTRRREGRMRVNTQQVAGDLSTLLSQAMSDIMADASLFDWLQQDASISSIQP